jgi:hypothetical protein
MAALVVWPSQSFAFASWASVAPPARRIIFKRAAIFGWFSIGAFFVLMLLSWVVSEGDEHRAVGSVENRPETE